MSDLLKGHVKWFNDDKGFGFIQPEEGEDIFVHYNDINAPGGGRRTLHQDQKVTFKKKKTDRGWQAEDVTVVE